MRMLAPSSSGTSKVMLGAGIAKFMENLRAAPPADGMCGRNDPAGLMTTACRQVNKLRPAYEFR
jgi:hypothetical protein